MPSIGKQLMFEELVDVLRAENYVFFARYEKLPVSEFSDLRRKLDKVSHRAMVVKNSIARRAFKNLGITNINGFIKGSVLLTLSDKDPQLVSKVLIDFTKDHVNFELVGACLEHALYDRDYVKGLSELPSRETLVATVVARLNAPISGFVGVMGQLMRSFVVTLDQICKQKTA